LLHGFPLSGGSTVEVKVVYGNKRWDKERKTLEAIPMAVTKKDVRLYRHLAE
jgi:hypothetical protein